MSFQLRQLQNYDPQDDHPYFSWTGWDDGFLPFSPFDGPYFSASVTYTYLPAVPLPATLPLMAAGLGAIGLLRRRRAGRH